MFPDEDSGRKRYKQTGAELCRLRIRLGECLEGKKVIGKEFIECVTGKEM